MEAFSFSWGDGETLKNDLAKVDHVEHVDLIKTILTSPSKNVPHDQERFALRNIKQAVIKHELARKRIFSGARMKNSGRKMTIRVWGCSCLDELHCQQ